jgi:hypothetical protein
MSSSESELHSLSAPVPSGPEDEQVFRLAQLLLLLETAADLAVNVRTLDRLGIFDFLAANPFIALPPEDASATSDHLRLRLAGFSDHQLTYAATGPRFVSRRQRLQADLAALLALGLVRIDQSGYVLTALGSASAQQLNSVYADAYRDGARVILRRLGKVSDSRLTEHMETWLGQSWLLIDVLDDVTETSPFGSNVGHPSA